MTNIGIFLGSFDPIHKGHLTIALEALKSLDKVLLVPLYDAPHKSSLSSSDHRVTMCQIATKDFDQLEVYSKIIEEQISGYSMSLVETIQRDYPDSKLHYILGSDVFKYLLEWETEKELSSLVEYMVIMRDQEDLKTCHDIAAKIKTSTHIMHLDLPCISSSLIKEQKAMDYLHEEVKEYIIKNALYWR